jgi:hypothetical protein
MVLLRHRDVSHAMIALCHWGCFTKSYRYVVPSGLGSSRNPEGIARPPVSLRFFEKMKAFLEKLLRANEVWSIN